MPALANIRHERLARAYIRLGVKSQAYLKAGYRPTTRNALDASAGRALGYAKVKARIRELKKQMATRNRVTVDSLIEELDEARALAARVEQPGAMTQATTVKAKLVGLLVDRKETGQPGDFASLKTPAEVIAALRAELGDAAVDAFLAALAGQEADKADLLINTEPTGTLN
jgi:hypothetical protein